MLHSLTFIQWQPLRLFGHPKFDQNRNHHIRVALDTVDKRRRAFQRYHDRPQARLNRKLKQNRFAGRANFFSDSVRSSSLQNQPDDWSLT